MPIIRRALGCAQRAVRRAVRRVVRRRGEQAGFSLIEAMVALVVVAMAIEMLVRSAATGLAAAGRERATLEALARAQSHLAELRDPAALVPGRISGPDGGGYTYMLTVTPLAEVPPLRGLRLSGGVAPLMTVLYQAEVVISWRDGAASHSVSLASQAIGAVPP
jgi:general secretion pathway protein I